MRDDELIPFPFRSLFFDGLDYCRQRRLDQALAIGGTFSMLTSIPLSLAVFIILERLTAALRSIRPKPSR